MTKVGDVILCVEDEEDDAFLLGRAFQRAGITNPLVVVPDGKTAMGYLAGEGRYADRMGHPFPCLVLLDLNMPGMPGLEVLKWVRSTPSTCAVVVIVLSSSSQDTDVQSAYLTGANGYLVKPGSLEELVVTARALKE